MSKGEFKQLLRWRTKVKEAIKEATQGEDEEEDEEEDDEEELDEDEKKLRDEERMLNEMDEIKEGVSLAYTVPGCCSNLRY